MDPRILKNIIFKVVAVAKLMVLLKSVKNESSWYFIEENTSVFAMFIFYICSIFPQHIEKLLYTACQK